MSGVVMFMVAMGATATPSGKAPSCPISEAKPLWARSVAGVETLGAVVYCERKLKRVSQVCMGILAMKGCSSQHAAATKPARGHPRAVPTPIHPYTSLHFMVAMSHTVERCQVCEVADLCWQCCQLVVVH